MGDSVSTANESILHKIQLFEQAQDRLLGRVDIYRLKEPPYEYIIDYKKTYIDDKARMTKDLHLMNQIKNIQHPNLAKIYHSELKEDVQLCIKHQVLHTYTNYYNFTLQQAVEKKKFTNHIFSEADIVYIAKSLVDLALELKKYGISKAVYRVQEVFLSPEGYVKLYLLGIDQDNRHSCYYTVLSQKERLPQFLLAPQQLQSLKKLQLEGDFDQYKADLFAIGLIIVELITLDHAKFYYNYELFEVMTGKLNFILDTYASAHYSQDFIGIVKQFLQPEPERRIDLKEANQNLALYILQRKNKVHCIRLEADPVEKTQTVPDPPKGIRVGLNNITSKLTPKPISMLSSTSTIRPTASTKATIKRSNNQP